jgi:hypothetical protein
MSYRPREITPRKTIAWTGVVAVIVLASFAAAILIVAAWGTYDRWQQRASRSQNRTQTRRDASNHVAVNQIRIGYFRQELLIAKQRASIRQAQAVGIREAQDKIAATLTPLYVQFEMTEALKAIATSGRNSSVVFVPSGAAGIPLVAGANGPRVDLPGAGR